MGSATIEGELWGAKARDWAEIAECTTASLWSAMVRAVQIHPGERVLDLGCGAGGASVLLRDAGANIWGFDASSALLEIARERVPEGQFQQGEMEELPFEAGFFDDVFAANSIQYAADQGRAVREALRVKKRGGRLVVGMWCEQDRCDLAEVMKEVGPLMPSPTPDAPPPPPTLSNCENLLSLLESNGARVLGSGEVECRFEFPSETTLIRGLNSAGIIVGMARAIGEDRMTAALLKGCERFRCPDGGYLLRNWFRWVLCE